MANTEAVRVVFLGTPAFAVPSLEALVRTESVQGRPLRVVGVFTQPDRQADRRRVTAPPVKEAAQAHGIPVFQPERLRRAEGMSALRALAPDLIVVVAYAQILPSAALSLPRHGCLNVHASLLPRHRGAAPIQAAILEGDAETGVSIMLMDEGLDTGPVLAEARVPIGPEDTAESLAATLATAGADLLLRVLPGWLAGTVEPRPQDESRASMTRPLRKTDGAIDWRQPAVRIARLVRAMHPWPGAYTTARGDLLKVLAAEARSGDAAEPPGTLLARDGEAMVATGEGLLLLARVQQAGRRPLSGAEWLRGASALRGTLLGEP
jgi:methionyl-tRNA formyltransferase